MAKPKVSLVKKSGAKKALGAGPVLDFVFEDNQDSTCTVLGVNAAGNTVDISPVASITASSGDTSRVTVDVPSSMLFDMHAVGPLTIPGTPVNIEVVATWNDGSKGPFSFTLPVEVVASGVTGVTIVPGTPTVH